MRIFMNQTNMITTSPVLDNEDNPVTDAVIVVKILNGNTEIPDSEITLDHVSGGIYTKSMPVLEELEQNETYNFEVTVTVEGIVVWYLKEPIKSIIRTTQPRNL